MFQKFDHCAGHYLLLSVLWAVTCLPNLGGPSLWDVDEGNNAECFREMRASGNLIVPTFNYLLREDKPALLYWCQIASAEVFGVNETAARFPSAVAVLLTVLAVYELGRLTFGVRTALLAGIILATSVGLLGAGHFANPDALLSCFSTMFLVLFWHDYRNTNEARPRGRLIGAGIAAGLAVLAKGPVGLVLPAGIIVFFLVWQRQLRKLWDARLPGMILVFLLVAAPWYVWVGIETKGAWLSGFFGTHHVKRTLTAMESHSGPPWYYLAVLLVGLAPWSIFLVPAGWHAWRRLRAIESVSDLERAAIRFLIVYCAVYFTFFSLVRTKLPNYVLPSYPALVLLTAHLLERWRRGEFVLPARVVSACLGCLALLGVGLAGGLLLASGWMDLRIVRGRAFPDLAGWAWLGMVPVAGAAVGAWMLKRDARGWVIASVAGCATLLAVTMCGWGLQAMEPYKAARQLARGLPADQLQRDVRMSTFAYFQPSLVFYCRREMLRWVNEEQATAFLQRPLPSFLFVPEIVWKQMEPRLSATKPRVLARHRDLYSGQTIVVVSNE
jgi:4-amino-4-deoxy-L-arabinose transferase-like glycosyltransferase